MLDICMLLVQPQTIGLMQIQATSIYLWKLMILTLLKEARNYSPYGTP